MASAISLKILFWVLIIIAASFEAIGDIFFKKWTLENKNWILIVGFIIYFISTAIWAISLKYEYLSKAISILTIINLIVVVLVGMLYFNEDLSLTNKIGIVLGIISVALIEI
jgi:multidrug transporter EmrE-like cation transporter